ncbi:protein modifying enzyme [Lithospermum erythrorhizon]|uniref:procollagen-proline 4-dioxygenase n=1 Tax=Lithospermum erythrorhizon TaxID=34254 RepID=A0AAV3RRB1_LITER
MENIPMILTVTLFFFFLFPDLTHSGDRKFLMRKGSVLKLPSDARPPLVDPSRVTQISWKPRAFLYRNFLTEEECEHLKKLARDKLKKSMVADNESGKSVESKVRTSSGMFLRKHQDEIVSGIETRLAAWTFLPEENGEAMQILHYENGQKYEPHFDYFHDKVNQVMGGHRIATILMYLSQVEKGGETVFPNSEEIQVKGDDWSECAKQGYAGKPISQYAFSNMSRILGDVFVFPEALLRCCAPGPRP